VYVSANSEVTSTLYDTGIANVPLTFWIAVLFAVVLWVMMRYTRIGRGLTAIGRNESAAIFSAVRTRGLKVLAFALSGFAAGLGVSGTVTIQSPISNLSQIVNPLQRSALQASPTAHREAETAKAHRG